MPSAEPSAAGVQEPHSDKPRTVGDVGSGQDRSDADLLAAHVAGDGAAFGVLFARHRDRLWALALRTCNDPEIAADGLQEGLIAAFRRAGTFRADAAVTTWLHRIVVNACLDRLRALKVRRAEPLPEDLEDHQRRSRPHAAEVIDPAEASVNGEQRQRVRDALAQLPLEQRAAVVLVDMEGYPVAEVALILECAVGTVKSRCSRGRARLAVLLADVLSLEEADGGAPVDGNPVTALDVSSVTSRGPPDVGAAPA
ncbi:MAG: RNA polymerase sigma factor SigM [Nocardioidaceae bacterium]|nr:RNA polymerase sigma factor SigM [Nocardioidaceae bacterium]